MELRPARLPRGIPCVVAATVYHPPCANDNEMLEYLSKSLTDIEGLFPGCGIIIAGDFNHLNIKNLARQFQLKQLVHLPTRGMNTLDLVLTNLHPFYESNSATSHPPFGLSDHCVITLYPKQRESNPTTKKVIYKRDTRPSRKQMLGNYLNRIDWHLLDQLTSCSEKNDLFTGIITTGLNYIMPEKAVTFHRNDPPWITEDFKRLIKQRQRAFSTGNSAAFKFYRNKVNKMRKACRAKFYTSKVEHLKQLKPKEWWREAKRLCGMTTVSNSTNFLSQLQLENAENLSPPDLANLINNTFLEPMKDFSALSNTITEFDSQSDDFPLNVLTTPELINHKLNVLNRSKAPGPDGIPNWILKEFAGILSKPISIILNSSYLEQKLPSAWKQANIIPIPKIKPIRDINKNLRPISLTPALSKLAEDIVIEKYVSHAVLEIVSQDQFGGIPKSSATLALISIIHTCAQATDGTGASVRVLLFDYRKAFDLIDHNILVQKIRKLSIPLPIVNWIFDFLTSREQRVKLARDCFSEWGKVPSGVPQGTKLGPWLFILMINDLNLTDFEMWKYIDDTTAAEVISKDSYSSIQTGVNQLEAWSVQNKLQLQTPKCKELLFQFTRVRSPFPSVVLSSGILELVDHAKVLGLTISHDLKWSKHVAEIIQKANKRKYFITQLKRANVPAKDIINFYCSCVRPVLEYSCEVFHFALPAYLSDAIEQVQRRITSIICPGIPYRERLQKCNLIPLSERRYNACSKLFNQVVNDPHHKLSSLLPDRLSPNYELRKIPMFQFPKIKTDRFLKTFIPACIKEFS